MTPGLFSRLFPDRAPQTLGDFTASRRLVPIAQGFHLTSAERKTLLVAGAAAGMSATFGAPVAAMLLAVELLLFEWKPRSFVPVALASAAAMMTREVLTGGTGQALFPVPVH